MEILYKDAEIVVVIKPRGALSEAGDPQSVPALLQPLVGKVWTVHRLDRTVGGVMVYAKSAKAAAALTAAMQAGALQKVYTAVVTGTPQESAELRDYLYHDSRRNKTFVVDGARKDAKEAILSYRLLSQKKANGVEFSALSVKLQTGRSHQIRVQLGSRGMPLCGDGKYGSKDNGCKVALWSHHISFEIGEDRVFATSMPPFDKYPWNLFNMDAYNR